jgi:hypothetical protein
MVSRFLRALFAALLSLLCDATFRAGAARPRRAAAAQKAIAEPRLRMAAEPGSRLRLAPVTEKEVERVRARNAAARGAGTANVSLKRVAIGVGRDVAREAWKRAGSSRGNRCRAARRRGSR